MNKKKTNDKVLMGAIIFAGVAIASALIFFALQFGGGTGGLLGGGGANEEEVLKIVDSYVVDLMANEIIPGQYQDDYVSPDEIGIENDAILGDKNAPLTIIEFSDYQCPFCKKFIDDAYQDIKKEYIETGKANLVFRDFPLGFHENALPAALAAECAKDQGTDETYYSYHDKLFAEQKLDREALITYASELDLDTEEFTSCLDDQKFLDEVQKDMAEAQSAGISGTPGFLINGKVISGAQPFPAFKAAIDAALAE